MHHQKCFTWFDFLPKGIAECTNYSKYVVAEFEEEDPPVVDIVGKRWLHTFTSEESCNAYWPNTRNGQRAKALMASEALPNSDTWTSWSVKILYISKKRTLQ